MQAMKRRTYPAPALRVPCFGAIISRALRAVALLWALVCGSAWADATPVCAPQLLGSWVAPETQAGHRPADGWQAVPIPHNVHPTGPGWSGAVWYRLDWQLHCPPGLAPGAAQLALAVSGMRLAGAVYWNDQLLWRDRSLVEPYSRSWNMPRWWPVAVADPQAAQTVWVRVVSTQTDITGLGYVELGGLTQIQEAHAARTWRQRTSYVLTAGLSLTIACVALVVWLWRRSEKIYLWMGLMQICWTLYLCVILSLEPWPGLSSQALSLLNLVSFMLYGHCFLVFVLRFHGQRPVLLERGMWAALALWVAYMVVDGSQMRGFGQLSLVWGVVVFNGACLYAIYRALRTRQAPHLLLGVACAALVVVAVHDLDVALRRWDNDQTWSYVVWPLNMLMLAVLLGWQVASQMRRMDGFNTELTAHVAQARAELAQVLAQQHAQALQHAKLQERVQLAHDLHDGLGGSLVRSMALVAQAPQPLTNERVLSLLKTLRDDLRQIIDTGSSSAAVVPATPVEWLAPLRHRVTRILDELQMQVHWQIDAQWSQAPSAAQCLGLLRVLEEACANIIKHSQARQVRVVCTQPQAGCLQLTVADDGVGFDVQAVQQSGLSVGMRSMQARVDRLGAQLQVQSRPGSTVLQVRLALDAVQPAAAG